MPRQMTRDRVERLEREGGTVAARLAPEDWEIMRELQAQTGVSASAVVRMLLREWKRRQERRVDW